MIQPVVGMFFIAHNLINRLSDVNPSAFEFHLNQWKPIYKNCDIIAVHIFADNRCLIRHLENIFGMVGIEKGKINLCSILSFQDKFIPEDFRTLENGLAKHMVKNPFPLFASQRTVQLISIESFKLHLEVFQQGIVVRNGHRGITLVIQLLNELGFKCCLALVSHIFISIT